MTAILTIILLIFLFEYIKQNLYELSLINLENKRQEESFFLSQWPYIFFGLIYLFIEMAFLLLTGHSWCNSFGCKLVENIMGKDENKLVILGNVLFLFLLLLEILKLEAKRKELFFKFPFFEKYNPVILLEKIEGFFLTLAVIIEGFFFATQVFILRDICLFCIGSMYIVIANFIVWCLRNKNYKDLAIGLIGFVAIFYMTAFMVSLLKLNKESNTYSVYNTQISYTQKKTLKITNLPCETIVSNNKNSTFYLFASKYCPHCKHVEEFINKNKRYLNATINICFVDKDDNLNYLKTHKISYVPALFNAKGDFLKGGDKDIIKFLKSFVVKSNFKNYKSDNIHKNLTDKNKSNTTENALENFFKNEPICTFNGTCN